MVSAAFASMRCCSRCCPSCIDTVEWKSFLPQPHWRLSVSLSHQPVLPRCGSSWLATKYLTALRPSLGLPREEQPWELAAHTPGTFRHGTHSPHVTFPVPAHCLFLATNKTNKHLSSLRRCINSKPACFFAKILGAPARTSDDGMFANSEPPAKARVWRRAWS